MMKVDPNTIVGLPGKKERAKYVWRCELCGRGLCSKRSYLEHKNTHVSARPFKCESCDYAAASQMTLRRHTLRQHVPRSNWHYPCPYCEQAFVEPTSYQAHLRHKHTGFSGTFGCDVCDYKTLSSKNFADHTVKHASVRSRKKPAPKIIKDFTNRKLVCKFLVEDELGVGWGQQPNHDEQMVSLRRVTYVEQDRKRRAPVVTSVYSISANQRQQPLLSNSARLPGNVASSIGHSGPCSSLMAPRRASTAIRNRSDFGTTNDHDHEYQTSNLPLPQNSHYHRPATSTALLYPLSTARKRRAALPYFGITEEQSNPLSLPAVADQACLVPEAECYIEVATAESEARSFSLPAITVDPQDSGSSSDESSDNDDPNNDDDDSDSCSSNGSVEINQRITALTAEIDQEARTEMMFDTNEPECQDLGNDVLPDGQVDFDLD